MKLVRLHDNGGYPLFINPEAVESVVRRDVRGGGSIVYVTGRPMYVEEAPEEATRLLEERPAYQEVSPEDIPSHGAPRPR